MREGTKTEFAKKLRKEMTDAERKVWQHLRAGRMQGLKFKRQVPIGSYIVDFASPLLGLVIELDGGQHKEREEYDEVRTTQLRANGFTVLRFWNDDVLLRTDVVLEEIWRQVLALSPAPSPVNGRGEFYIHARHATFAKTFDPIFCKQTNHRLLYSFHKFFDAKT